MKHYIGHNNGMIVFATQAPAVYEFIAPDGMTIMEVDNDTYTTISPTVGKLNFRVENGLIIPIPQKPSEFHEWNWQSLEWVENAALVATAYIHKRKVAYPPIGDQLDALWKGGDALTQMQGQILAVKATYPKPQQEPK